MGYPPFWETPIYALFLSLLNPRTMERSILDALLYAGYPTFSPSEGPLTWPEVVLLRFGTRYWSGQWRFHHWTWRFKGIFLGNSWDKMKTKKKCGTCMYMPWASDWGWFLYHLFPSGIGGCLFLANCLINCWVENDMTKCGGFYGAPCLKSRKTAASYRWLVGKASNCVFFGGASRASPVFNRHALVLQLYYIYIYIHIGYITSHIYILCLEDLAHSITTPGLVPTVRGLPRCQVCLLGSGGFAKVFLMEDKETTKRRYGMYVYRYIYM